jgi:hypothetical protein
MRWSGEIFELIIEEMGQKKTQEKNILARGANTKYKGIDVGMGYAC